jgi:hypothetical protein
MIHCAATPTPASLDIAVVYTTSILPWWIGMSRAWADLRVAMSQVSDQPPHSIIISKSKLVAFLSFVVND